MAKYRKKPVVVEAFQLSLPIVDPAALPDWWHAALANGVARINPGVCSAVIHGIDAEHRAESGDWIIRGIAGEIYPCKPEIFFATYDKVSD